MAKISNVPASDWPDIGLIIQPTVDELSQRASALRIKKSQGPLGCHIIDCGVETPGSLEAGILVAKICMGGLGYISITPCPSHTKNWAWQVSAHSSNPVLACLGSQYAGWSLKTDDYSSLASGPGRALAAHEPLFKELQYQTKHRAAVLVLEVEKPPPKALVEKVLNDCNVKASNLTFILTPTSSLAGTVQVAARCLEVALHKAHDLKFPLENIIDGAAHAPLPPPGAEFTVSMGRTNDAIIYGGNVHLFVSGDDGQAEELALKLPSRNSKDYGKPFADIFKAFKGDFYAMDASLFSPARAVISNIDTGRSFHAGGVDETVLDNSFGYGR
ncbi:MAG: methenyltetrahydromethanopterin cyclohydrolase [Alphaproteobacteria bacterium GM7ARS4]|nr:methenyltetrahydromethanopterin cyclohydrolase [Alphaproteobacteria bacterium GM7ARS4]